MTREIYAYCGRHCKEPVYSAEKIDQLLQALETGDLQKLAWYNGNNNAYHYEFSGTDPQTIGLKTFTSLIDAIANECVGLTSDDMVAILPLSFHVKLWHNGNEFYATKYNGEFVLVKVNSYCKIFNSDAEVTTTTNATIKQLTDEAKERQNADSNIIARLEALENQIGVGVIVGEQVIFHDDQFESQSYTTGEKTYPLYNTFEFAPGKEIKIELWTKGASDTTASAHKINATVINDNLIECVPVGRMTSWGNPKNSNELNIMATLVNNNGGYSIKVTKAFFAQLKDFVSESVVDSPFKVKTITQINNTVNRANAYYTANSVEELPKDNVPEGSYGIVEE